MQQPIDINSVEYNTKKKIFTAAARLFAERGYNAVSMREIAEQSGLSKPMIYYYFGSKEGIYRELAETGVSHLFSALDEVIVMPITAGEKLTLIMKKFFHACVLFPEFTKFFSNLACSAEKTDFLKNFKVMAGRKEQTIVGLFREGIESGEFDKSLQPEIAAHVFMGIFMHFIMQQFAKKERILSEELAENLAGILLYGIKNKAN
ncbi:MAG TPA: TetR/AcrR family transcriptional regulator [bacterium]|nr:TetR/AcrR family transcriptional regulator [bacterium]HPN44454.1 TetR/AcrR family transcriptional regulator [bacterium]